MHKGWHKRFSSNYPYRTLSYIYEYLTQIQWGNFHLSSRGKNRRINYVKTTSDTSAPQRALHQILENMVVENQRQTPDCSEKGPLNGVKNKETPNRREAAKNSTDETLHAISLYRDSHLQKMSKEKDLSSSWIIYILIAPVIAALKICV